MRERERQGVPEFGKNGFGLRLFHFTFPLCAFDSAICVSPLAHTDLARYGMRESALNLAPGPNFHP